MGANQTFDGEWTIANSRELLGRFTEWLARNDGAALDLAGVETCDTAGLQLLCSLLQTDAVRIVAMSPAIEAAAAELGVRIPGGAAHGV